MNHPGQADEILDAEALGSQVEDRVGREACTFRLGSGGFPGCGSRFLSLSKDRLQGIAQRLAPLAESSLDHSPEQFFVTVQGCARVTGQADDS